MICNETEKKVEILKSKGYIENINFRVVHFGNKTEIKMIRK